jgi:adenylate kinase family enzyme
MFRPIHIIGGPGSGKSYAAKYLSARLGISAHDLDDLFWDRAAQTYGVRASQVDRDVGLLEITQQDGWVIEGVYFHWLKPSFERADSIFVLSPQRLFAPLAHPETICDSQARSHPDKKRSSSRSLSSRAVESHVRWG